MFKVGDIVWAKTNMYAVTFYHRPCKVLKCLGSEIMVQVLDSGDIFTVDGYRFESVPMGGILEPGDKLIHKGTKEMLTFIKYLAGGCVQCRNSLDVAKQFSLYDVESFGKIFYI